MIQIISDLHQINWNNAYYYGSSDTDFPFTLDCINKKASVVLMAGDLDINIQRVIDMLTSFANAYPDKTFIAIPGNHEFYNQNIQSTLLLYNESHKSLPVNAHLASRHTMIHNGVRYVSCILWSYILPSASKFVVKNINDFTIIKDENGGPLGIIGYNALHAADLTWLVDQLEMPFDGPTVVMTHHAPSWESVALPYIGDKCNSVFVSKLDDIIEKYEPSMWVHGHTHSPVDYYIFNTRVICNPLGYPQENSSRYNVLDFCVELH